MRRFLTVCTILCAAGTWFVHAQQPVPKAPTTKPAAEAKAAPAKAAPFTLSVDGIMSGTKLVGNAPSGVRFLPDSSKIVFSWQKPGEDRANSYVVGRDGTGLKLLSAEEARALPTAPTGRLDGARKRLLAAEGGNIVIYDVATNARRQLMKTAAIESNPRWARGDTAVTFIREGNLFLVTLDGSAAGPAEVQLTDVATAAGEGSAAGAGTGRGVAGGTGQRGGQAQAGAQGARGGSDQAQASESQRVLRQEEMALIDLWISTSGRVH